MNRDEFVEQYYVLVKKVVAMAQKARREGLLALEDYLDTDEIEQRDILEYGMRFVVDGTDASLIAAILSNIVSQEKDEYARTLKTMKMEAVLGIQQGENPAILYYKMNSFTDISLKDDKIYATMQYGYLPEDEAADTDAELE